MTSFARKIIEASLRNVTESIAALHAKLENLHHESQNTQLQINHNQMMVLEELNRRVKNSGTISLSESVILTKIFTGLKMYLDPRDVAVAGEGVRAPRSVVVNAQMCRRQQRRATPANYSIERGGDAKHGAARTTGDALPHRPRRRRLCPSRRRLHDADHTSITHWAVRFRIVGVCTTSH